MVIWSMHIHVFVIYSYMILCFGVALLRYTYIDPKIRFVTRIKHSYPVEDILLFYDSYDSVPQFVLQPKN